MDKLYIITPYFNFVNYKSTRNNIDTFIQNFSKHKNVELILVEGLHKTSIPLPDYSDKIYKHLKFPVKDIIWVKENIINLAFKHLPEDWKYGGWFDRDIVMCNPNWVEQAKIALQYYDLIQPWRECLYLNEKYEHEHVNFGEWQVRNPFKVNSFCEVQVEKEKTGSLNDKKFAHPGQAWCVNRKFFDKMGGLYDHCILGSGDGIMMFAYLQKKNHEMIERLKTSALPYIEKVKDCKLGYIDGMILHLYHGKLSNRKYLSKHNYYDMFGFNPLEHLDYDENGVLYLTPSGKEFEQYIKTYLIGRAEDENL